MIRRRTRRVNTIFISELKAEINEQLDDPKISNEVKKALCTLLEDALYATGNYRGYNQAFWSLHGGAEAWQEAGKPENKDLFYYGIEGKNGPMGEYARIYF